MAVRLSDTFRMTPVRNTALFEEPEQPSVEITVKILLTESVSPVLLKDLNRGLTNYDMTVSADHNNRNAVVVRGIPYIGYVPNDILKVVQKLDEGARIIS